MKSKILLIDNDTRYLDKLSNSLEKELEVQTTQIIDFDELDITSEIDLYDIFFIRLSKQTKDAIQVLSENEKMFIILGTRDLDETIDEIHSYNPTDYIITSENKNISLATNIVKRLLLNKNMTALVVDDSKSELYIIKVLLQQQGLKCITFDNGKEAWDYLDNPDSNKVDIVLADYQMPILDGYELTKLIRSKFSFEELPILVLSATSNTKIISRFLRIGANDYIPKPFITEEFIARLSNTLTNLNMFRDISSMALTDHLTGLNNRAYIFEVGKKAIDIIKRNNGNVTVGLCDIDNFKQINDTFGHDFGDQALKLVSNELKKSIRSSDICARFGGEEFLFILPECPKEIAIDISENIRKAVEKIDLKRGIKPIKITISVGITSNVDSIHKMISTADELMYKAKESGKNKVCHE